MDWMNVAAIILGALLGLFSNQIYNTIGNKLKNVAAVLAKESPWIKQLLLRTFLIFAGALYVFSYFLSIILRKLTRSIKGVIISFLILIFVYSMLWYLAGLKTDSNPGIIDWLYRMAGYTSPDDHLSLGLFSMGTTVLTFQLTATLTLFYFIFREQRTASISSVHVNSNSIIVFIVVAIVTIFMGTHLSSMIGRDVSVTEASGIKVSLSFSSLHAGRILAWGLLLVCAFILGIRAVLRLIQNLKIKKMLDDLILYISKQLSILRFTPLPQHRKKIYANLVTSVESLQQLMSMAVDKGMEESYISNRKKWGTLLSNLLCSPRLKDLDNTVISEFLLKRDGKKYDDLFRFILKSQTAIIMVLIKNHKIEEANNSVDLFFELKPSENELHIGYFNALQELALLMYANDVIGLEPIFKGLESIAIADEETVRNGIYIIYKSLINKAVAKNDVKMLSSIVYSMTKTLDQTEEAELKPDPSYKFLQLKSNISLIEEDLDTYTYCVIFIVLQAALKSVELAHYSCTGFLVKFIVTAFKCQYLNEAYSVFTENGGANNPYLGQRENFSKINVSFNFNEKTLGYCQKKLTILLYGQQQYVVERRIDFGEVPKSYLDICHLNCNYIDYLFDKIEASKSKYGLLFLEEKKQHKEITYFEELKNEIRLHIGVQDELEMVT
ncbi:hypothetical protein [Paenibacillus sp. BC26]|uniref:hypothetical protein n=1 Tax=Paenibacillus sp. BC26 TaxID=1881032 RepID=UPI0008EDDEEC|nr:hypothetical protein [Paenibacillus sp. BC26]SFS77597.1 hypothetical protein SAMN05428962_2794 [Paenibacillus sp. BC26]